jgi:hypothetical protein
VFDRVRGVLHDVKGEGIHFCVPILQYPELFDVRVTPYAFSSNTGSKDLQRVNITLRVLYRPEEESLRKIFLQMGRKYAKQVFTSIGNEVLKSVVAQFDAGELITQRELVCRVAVAGRSSFKCCGACIDARCVCRFRSRSVKHLSSVLPSLACFWMMFRLYVMHSRSLSFSLSLSLWVVALIQIAPYCRHTSSSARTTCPLSSTSKSPNKLPCVKSS